MGTKRVVVIEGDDAAPEAVRPTVTLLKQLNLDIEWLHPPFGNEALARHGTLFPDDTREAIDKRTPRFLALPAARQNQSFGICDGAKTPMPM